MPTPHNNAQKGDFEYGGDTVDNEAIVRELAGLQAEQRSMRNDLKEIKNMVGEMSQKPARRIQCRWKRTSKNYDQLGRGDWTNKSIMPGC